MHNRAYDRAISDITEAIQLNLKDAKVFYFRGVAYFRNGAYERAVGDFTETIRLDPKNAEAFYYRGRAHRAKRDYGLAISDYTVAVEKGYAAAGFDIGMMYVMGDGIARDYGQGMHWLRIAADGGTAML